MRQKTITIPMQEYQQLQSIARRFEQARGILIEQNDLVFVEPPVQDAEEVILEMKKTKKYSGAFLKSLKQGLKESMTFSKE